MFQSQILLVHDINQVMSSLRVGWGLLWILSYHESSLFLFSLFCFFVNTTVCLLPADDEGMKEGDILSSDPTREKAEAVDTWGSAVSWKVNIKWMWSTWSYLLLSLVNNIQNLRLGIIHINVTHVGFEQDIPSMPSTWKLFGVWISIGELACEGLGGPVATVSSVECLYLEGGGRVGAGAGARRGGSIRARYQWLSVRAWASSASQSHCSVTSHTNTYKTRIKIQFNLQLSQFGQI